MNTIKRLAEKLRAPGVNVQQVARLAGVSARTLYRLREPGGYQSSPTFDTIHRIQLALRGRSSPARTVCEQAQAEELSALSADDREAA